MTAYGAVVMLTARNCMATTGLAWQRVLKLANAHGIQVLRLGPRCTAIAAAPLLAALEAAQIQPHRAPMDEYDRALVEAGARER